MADLASAYRRLRSHKTKTCSEIIHEHKDIKHVTPILILTKTPDKKFLLHFLPSAIGIFLLVFNVKICVRIQYHGWLAKKWRSL